MLNQDISTEEIMESISELKVGKDPGMDGLTAKFYKICKNQILPYLGTVMNDVLKGEQVPESWRQAAMSLIPKEGLEPLEVKNYRPILLLNSDYKIYAKILATRLSSGLYK